MKPNLEKIDLPHLKADIQKYEKAGVFTDGAYSYWQRFLDEFESTYGMLPAVPVPWIVNDLPTVTPILPTDVHVPVQISQLHQLQTQPQQQVHASYNLVFWIYNALSP